MNKTWIFNLLLLPLVLLYETWAVVECLTRSGYQTSSSSERCVECELIGYLDPDTSLCVYVEEQIPVTSSVSTLGYVNSTCEDGYCLAGGNCTRSQFGIQCEECSNSGYLTPTEDLSGRICVCYSTNLDPKLYCAPTVYFNDTSNSKLVNFTRNYDKYSCVAHQSEALGCFAQPDDSAHRYGDPNPPVPTACCSDFLGPPPGELTELIDPANFPFQECNTYGSPDPNEVNTTIFRTCSNHGLFNFTSRTCQCQTGWKLGVVSVDVNSCVQCDGHFGPSPMSLVDSPPYCIAPYTPDPITGVDSICGGRGDYVFGTCVCYSSSLRGYWKLAPVGGKFDATTNAEVFVQSCADCSNGTFPTCL